MTMESSFFRCFFLYCPRIVIALFFLFGILVAQCLCKTDTANAQKLTGTSADSTNSGTSADDDDVNLEACQRRCYSLPYGSNLIPGGIACIQDCNDRSWKSYDKRMQKLK